MGISNNISWQEEMLVLLGFALLGVMSAKKIAKQMAFAKEWQDFNRY